ncbi:hypothetical protein [Bittarella massiliensis (ex Durand et al. 2017)]|nr:hypothetical protein [Bittarella massiliensis (ex Durand et al. 2017)]MBO1680154.1 hypothetical protein [Bittarella massiliensis (ex Durand et al. 2017)]
MRGLQIPSILPQTAEKGQKKEDFPVLGGAIEPFFALLFSVKGREV